MAPTDGDNAADTGFRPSREKVTVSAYQLWQTQKLKTKLRQEYLARWENTTSISGTGRPVDAIISPCAPFAAPPHGKNRDATYTTIWNALDYATCAFPVTKIDPSVDAKKPPHTFLSKKDQKNYDLYDPQVFANAPVGLQLVGRTQEEEAVIAMTEIVDTALKSLKLSSKL
ncbi:hypothetical protein QCA50_004555 [Cerrena zonata]|uniref:Amidase domain-containing protein n=1 Tax=Cerrena zonata TaxID=2478898 RepID=A0AAW0GJT8_9APHY